MSINVEMGSKNCPYASANGEKWQKNHFSGKWQENAVVTAWSSLLLFIDFIKAAPIDNIFVNGSRGGIKGSPISRLKW